MVELENLIKNSEERKKFIQPHFAEHSDDGGLSIKQEKLADVIDDVCIKIEMMPPLIDDVISEMGKTNQLKPGNYSLDTLNDYFKYVFILLHKNSQ